MSTIPEESLTELLIQLKKIGPDEVRAILNPQPQIAYSLFELMVTLDLVDIEALNKAVASFTASQQAAPAPPVQTSPPILSPAPVTPSINMQQILQPPRTSIPESHFMNDVQPSSYTNYHSEQHMIPSNPPPLHPSANYNQASMSLSSIPGIPPEVLNSIPDDQRAMLMQVVIMTPAQIELLPPAERATFTQLRQAIGLPI